MTLSYFSSELAWRLGEAPGVSTLPEEKHSCLHTLQVPQLFLYPSHRSPLLASTRAPSMAYIAHSLMQQTAQQLYWETACFVFLIWKTKVRCKLCWLGSHTSFTQRKKEKETSFSYNRRLPLSLQDALSVCPPSGFFSIPAKKRMKYCLCVQKLILGNSLPVKRRLQATTRDSFSSGIN